MRISTFVATLSWGSFFALFWLMILGKVDALAAWGMVFCIALGLVSALAGESAAKVRRNVQE